MKPTTEYQEFIGERVHEVPNALYFRAWNWDEPIWLPKSQIEIVADDEENGEMMVHIPQWICEKEGINETDE